MLQDVDNPACFITIPNMDKASNDINRISFETTLRKLRDTAGSSDEPDSSTEQNGFTVVLDNRDAEQAHYQDVPLFAGQTLAIRTREHDTTTLQSAAMECGANLLQKASSITKTKKTIPEQIRRMRNLYQPGNMSFKQKCKNFYVQGKFMEDYEDNEPWNGELSSYYLSAYHDLSLDELRGYFTWRTELRKGNYQDHCSSFVRMYLDELINGIGAASAEESLRKMQEFEKGFLDAGFGGYENKKLRDDLHKRMLDFAVLSGVAPEIARTYVDRGILEKDAGIEILHYPKKFSNQEVFNALCTFGGKKTAESKLIRQHGAEAVRLFAAVWRLASTQYRENGKTLFNLCFGARRTQLWYLLEYTLYYNPKRRKETVYVLNPSRSYRFAKGEWYVSTYQSYYFNRKIIVAFLHETDRRLRLYLKAGNSLKERKDAVWAVPYIESVIEDDRQAKFEATRPKITIDFAGLEKIRQDALETQGSLLTEEDTQGAPNPVARQMKTSTSHVKTANNTGTARLTGNISAAKETEAVEQHTEAASAVKTQASAKAGTESSAVLPSGTSTPLDDTQVQLLRMLLCGEPVQALIAAQHGLPHVIADSINEALFDYIGDNAVDCDGDTLTLVEDYREEIAKIVG